MNLKLLGTKGRQSAESILAVKRETQAFESEDALKPLSGLGATLRAGKDYLVRARIIFTTAGGGAKVGFTVSADSSILTFEVRHLTAPGAAPINALLLASGSYLNGAITAGDYVAEIEGVILNAHGGTLQLLGSQDTQDANGISFYTGSYLELTEL